MWKFVIITTCIVCMLFKANAQQPSEVNLIESDKLHFEVNPSFLFITSSSSYFDMGVKVELSLKKGIIRGGFSGEYLKRNVHSVTVYVNESLTKITIINNDVNVYGVFVFGECFPFKFHHLSCNPYINIQAGVYLGDFQPVYVLSGGIGLEFFFHISDKFLLKPFVQLAFQEDFINPKAELSFNGLKSEIGFRFPF